jgi:uncharacterized Zn finger protein
MSWRRYHDFGYSDFFPRSTPRQAKGGIKAQSKRGTFGESWWAKRWIAVLESFQIGARLGRGRSYARRGQVLSIDIQTGEVKAKVQGSRPTPYGITIKLKPIPTAGWKKLADALGQQAVFAAKLLAGEMPQDIEQAFKAAGLSLFPEKLKDLATDCSCPDWSNPCKHIAAVYYLLGEEFDRDPFLIFKLRGMTREGLVGLLGASPALLEADEPPTQPGCDTVGPASCLPAKRVGQASCLPAKRVGQASCLPAKRRRRTATPEQPVQVNGQTLEPEAATAACAAFSPTDRRDADAPLEVAAFWNGGSLPGEFFGAVRAPALPAALPKRLGSFPFWRAAERFLDALEPVYQDASAVGLDVFLGQTVVLNQR